MKTCKYCGEQLGHDQLPGYCSEGCVQNAHDFAVTPEERESLREQFDWLD